MLFRTATLHLLGCFLVSACSSSVTPEPAAKDAAAPHDGAATHDDASDLTCPETLTAYCAKASSGASPCPSTLGDIPLPPLCTLDSKGNPQGKVSGEKVTCGAYTTWTADGIDSSQSFLFDAQTGKLVAVTSAVLGKSSCLAGPAPFMGPASCTGAIWYCDDGGSGGDAGADASGPPTLTLSPNQPASCPATFPTNGTSCTATAACDYVYPAGYHPSGCGATCVAADAGGFVWDVPGCI